VLGHRVDETEEIRMKIVGRAGLIAAGVLGLSVAVVGPAVAGAPGAAFAKGVPAANPRAGIQNNVLGAGLAASPAAWGALKLTNPDLANGVTHYGYNTSNGGPLTQDPHEAFKTEPDKNVYLVFGGHHYLYQGHEGGPRGYVTRVDLDATDPTQKVSLISDVDTDGNPFPTIDGITWDPFSHQLLITAEAASPTGGLFAISLDGSGNPVDGKAERLTSVGSGGYEGVQNDNNGNVYLVEDIGGAAFNGGKVPNSYVYRYLPTDKTDLSAGGTLQALQVLHPDGTPITAAELQADPTAAIISDLHTYGHTFQTRWVDVHSGTGAFNATTSAAAALATPFKRPENGVFRPGTHFGQFFFTETGDTSATSPLPGAFGGVFKLTMQTAQKGRLTPQYLGDVAHTGLDNISFATADKILVVEDAGDGLHAVRNALDSGYLLDLNARPGAKPLVRWLAEGRDSSATYDALTSPGYNDGDNEITGIHTSDGDPSVGGILGAKIPTAFQNGWRVFWTQQHGDNVTWEVSSVG
jgi:hypothetical protein